MASTTSPSADSPIRDSLEELPLRTANEIDRLVRGGHRYVADRIGPQHLWMRVVRSAVAHGTLLDVEIARAREVDGVLGVFTAADISDPVLTIPLRNSTPELEQYRQPVLASGVVRYVGEPVAIVVARSPHAAEDGADEVFVDIDPLPAVTHPDQRSERPDDRHDGTGILAASRSVSGDVSAAFAEADLVVSGRYEVPRLTGAPMEPRGLIAEWHDAGETLHLWGPTKYVFFTRRAVAELLDLDPGQVVVHGVDVGGGFGIRGEFYPEDFLVPWAARRLGRPVAWVEDRREHLLSMNHSRQQTHQFDLAVTNDGRLLAFRDVVSIDAGAYSRPIGHRQVPILIHCLPGPYAWEAMEMDVASVTTNKTPVGNLRGPGGTEAGFVRERAIDRAAARLGMDPIELRRKNLVRRDHFPHRIDLGDGHPIIYDSGDFRGILDRLVDGCGLDDLRAGIDRRRRAGELVGLGVGLFVEHTGNGRTETIRASLGSDGLLTIATGACDLGQGLTAFIIRLCRDELGIGPEYVRVLSGDSRAEVDARGTFGSRTAIFVGNAIAKAMAEVRMIAADRAARTLGVDVTDVHVGEDGFWSGRDFLHWKELAPIEVTATHEGEVIWGFGGHLAVTAVDPGTMDVEVERLAVVYDCGHVVERQAVEGQLRGGAVFGLGGALLEEIPYDDEGQPLATTLMDYLLPSYEDTPRIDLFPIEDEWAPGNPLGIKGAGEAGVLGVGGAVSNAVADALGAGAGDRITDLPIRPDRLLDLLADAGLTPRDDA